MRKGILSKSRERKRNGKIEGKHVIDKIDLRNSVVIQKIITLEILSYTRISIT